MSDMKFTGFTADTIDFFWELKFNNTKEWFHKNKDKYISFVKEPMDLFAYEMNETVNELDKTENYIYTVSRVNRDIRFSKDKSPYKVKRWVVFRPDNFLIWKESPAFFFEIGADVYSYGMGIFDTKPSFMKAFRNKIDANTSAFERLAIDISKQNIFSIEGEKYKRNLADYNSDYIMNWYQRKEIALIATREIEDILFSNKLIAKIKEDFKILMPFYKYVYSIKV